MATKAYTLSYMWMAANFIIEGHAAGCALLL